MTKNIIAISGSLRKDSYNTSLIRAAAEIGARHGLSVETLDMREVPLFDQDTEAAGFPAAVQALKDKIESADGVIIATPEYNRSIPGVLKNAIDWFSRPYGQNSFKGKPTIIIGATPSPVGTAVAQSHLKQVMTYLDTKLVGQPEIYVASAHEKFDASGKLTDADTLAYLEGALVKLKESLS